MILAVSDTGPIIHLDEINALDLLSVVDQLLVPQTVYEELEEGGVPAALESLSYDLVTADTKGFNEALDPGETAALAVASKHSGVLLTDDLEARDAAESHDIEVHGSVGVIILAYHQGHIEKPRAIGLMRSLQTETSLFIADAVVEQGIELLDDST